MSELQKHSGVYVMQPDRTIECYDRLPHQERYNLERLRHQTFIHKGTPPGSFWMGRAHPVEGESATVQEEVNSTYEFSRVEAWTAHELAAQTRAREYIAPVNGDNDSVPGRVIRLKDGTLGKVVDLNRQYLMPHELVTDWESVLGNIAYGPARLPLQLIRDNPGVKAFISIHEDNEHSNYPYPFAKWIPPVRKKDGFYLYDVRPHEDRELDRTVEGQFNVLRNILKKHKFTLFSGIDDPDPHLGNKVDRGFVRQTVLDAEGGVHLDSSLELFLVYLGTLGLGNVRRAFVVEVPGKLEINDKRKLLKLVSESFFFPVLGEMGAL